MAHGLHDVLLGLGTTKPGDAGWCAPPNTFPPPPDTLGRRWGRETCLVVVSESAQGGAEADDGVAGSSSGGQRFCLTGTGTITAARGHASGILGG